MRVIGGAADLRYKKFLTGETHHAAYFRLQIEDTVVDGMDRFLLDSDGKIAEVTVEPEICCYDWVSEVVATFATSFRRRGGFLDCLYADGDQR